MCIGNGTISQVKTDGENSPTCTGFMVMQEAQKNYISTLAFEKQSKSSAIYFVSLSFYVLCSDVEI